VEIKQPRCLRGCLRPGRKLSCQDPHIAVQQGPARAFRRVAFDSTGPAARCRPRSVEALSGHSMCEFSAGLENFEVTRTSAPRASAAVHATQASQAQRPRASGDFAPVSSAFHPFAERSVSLSESASASPLLPRLPCLDPPC
jgi:hypothetical protein